MKLLCQLGKDSNHTAVAKIWIASMNDDTRFQLHTPPLNDEIWLHWQLESPSEPRFRNPYIDDIDLNRVNALLRWNPKPPDREERRRIEWERNSESLTPAEMSDLEKLDLTMKSAEYRAERLANYYEGRVMLVHQHPSIQDRKSYKYWLSRSNFYKSEIERLEEEDYNRESRSVTPEVLLYNWKFIDELSKARGDARNAMGQLAALPGGKELVEADPKYWLDREEWRIEFRRDTSLDIEYYDYEHRDRSMTPKIHPPHHLGTAEGEAVRDRAREALGELARLPAVRALLEGEEHGEDRKDPKYWRSREKIYSAATAVIPPETALERARRHAYTYHKNLATFPEGRAILRNEDHGESASDPEYWRKKEKYYSSEYEKLVKSFWDRLRPARFYREETTLREAIGGAFGAAIGLSSHSEGRAILEAEDLRENEKDFRYWQGRRDCYRGETIKIEGPGIGPKVSYGDEDAIRFSNRLLSILSRIKPPDREFEDLSYLLTTPPRSPTASISKKRARRSYLATGHRPVTKNISGITNGTGGAVKNTTAVGASLVRRSSRSAGRRESKNAYRRRTDAVKVKPSHEPIFAQGPPNGLTTPNCGHSSNGAGEDDRDCHSRIRSRAAVRGPSRAKARPEPCLNTPKPYLTPESPQSSKAGVHKRPRRTKGSKRRSNRDGAYRGPRSVTQAVDPVSSRLRSSTIPL